VHELNNRGEAASSPDMANTKILSIQIKPDGLYFYASGEKECVRKISRGHDYPAESVNEFLASFSRSAETTERIGVNLVTDKVVIVPPWFPEERDAWQSAFAFVSQKLSEGEEVVKLIAPCGKRVLIAVEKPLLDSLSENLPVKPEFLHPYFSAIPTSGTALFYVTIYDNMSFILLKDKNAGLLSADALPTVDFPTILLHINRLISANKLGKIKMAVAGPHMGDSADKLAIYFPDIEVIL